MEVETAFQDNKLVPEKRKNRAKCVSIGICAVTAALVVIFCFTTGTVVEYYPDSTRENGTDICYRKREKLAFPSLFTAALGLFGIVLSTLVDRLSLVAEERHHLNERYDGSRVKMIKACFSGISWGPVISLISLAAVIVVLIILLTNIPWFELRYLAYIFSGIGVGPLIMQLLNLNTQSEVHISMILEKREMYVANGFAWYYYYNHLRCELQKFHKAMSSQPPKMELSLDKLVLLMPLNSDINSIVDLIALDERIEIVNNRRGVNAFRFPVYGCVVDGFESRYFAIHVVQDPLLVLRQMGESSRVKSVTIKTYKDEVKLLYRTLRQILKEPPSTDNEIARTGVLVPITVRNGEEESFGNGGLVRCILNEVAPLLKECTNSTGQAQRFNEILIPSNATKQIDDMKVQMKKKTSQHKEKNVEEHELRVMLPRENKMDESDSAEPKKTGHLVQEVGDTCSASTSGSQITRTADGNRQEL